MFKDTYDVIVVGGGHAGCEAAYSAAKMGSSVLLVTMNLQNIGQMSCNPAMGGIAKGQIVREIDALGGMSGQITDATMIQFKMLNHSKGPAMWSPRAQSDRMLFAAKWRSVLESNPNVDFYQEMCNGLLVSNNEVYGITTQLGVHIKSKKVILTNGTFLNGLIHIGDDNFGGGRAGEAKSTGITEQLIELGFESGRMKTGTPPRVDGRSLDYSKMEPQPGDDFPKQFSYYNQSVLKDQKLCYLTHTNVDVHEELKKGFDRSPMFNGRIKSVGPRYCPSIEDKINRFADKNRHQIFVEPEGWTTEEIYVNGFSTSLPFEVQAKAIRLISGFENAKIFRPGYAIEYDYFMPTQLKHSLETKLVSGLYFAGQINGTTGYEEAACQGLMAGINASLNVQEKEELVLSREEAYIGVLINDLVTKGTNEPYRMFTSRAEYRILLRQDNADNRLSPIGHQIGLLSDNDYSRYLAKMDSIDGLVNTIKNSSVDLEVVNNYLSENGGSLIKQKTKFSNVLTRPEVRLKDMMSWDGLSSVHVSDEVMECAEIRVKYEGYIKRERDQANKLTKYKGIKIPTDFDYYKLGNISTEAKQKLNSAQPKTIEEASKLSGVSPSDIGVLLVFMGR